MRYNTQHMDFVHVFNISLDLSSNYFAHFSGCGASFVYSCHSVTCFLESRSVQRDPAFKKVNF